MTGEELLIQMHRRRITQKELSRRLGLSEGMVSFYVHDLQPISPEREQQIRMALDGHVFEKSVSRGGGSRKTAQR